MKRTLLILFCFFIVQISGKAQTLDTGGASSDKFKGGVSGWIIDAKKVNKEGSIYYAEDWLSGSLVSKDNQKFEGIKFKYNLKNQTIIVQLDENQVKVVKPETIQEFEFTDEAGNLRTFENTDKYELEDIDTKGFVEVLHKGDFNLIYRHSILVKTSDSLGYGTVNSNAETKYLKKIDLLCSSEDKGFTKINNRKSILAFFGDKENLMNAYMKKNKVKLKEYNSISGLLTYYKSL